MATSSGEHATVLGFPCTAGCHSLRMGPSEGAAVPGEVIRFPSGQDHDTNCIACFSIEWRRCAGGLLASERTRTAGAVDHSSGIGRAGFSSRSAGGGRGARCGGCGARSVLLHAGRPGAARSDCGVFEAHARRRCNGVGGSGGARMQDGAVTGDDGADRAR